MSATRIPRLGARFVLAVVLATASAPGLAHAGPAPVPGTQHSPPRFVDEPRTGLRLNHLVAGKLEGYGFILETRITGAASENDRVRLDWKQSGKLIATAKCTLSLHADQIGHVACEFRDKPLTVKGVIEADLIYIDDADDKEYLLRTFKVTVAKYPNHGIAVWQLVPDDLLGAAWVHHSYPQNLRGVDGFPHFYFWVTYDTYMGDKLTMRCTVDGAKLADIKFSTDWGDPPAIVAETYSKSGTATKYVWKQVDGRLNAHFGVRSDYADVPADWDGLFLGEHPGAWVCLVRHDGNAIRELAFTVNDKGFISSDLQTAKNAAMTLGNVSAVELRFPKGARFDGRIRPDAMKKSRGFGLPWPDAPSVKASHATFPAASGWPDPK